MYALYNDGAINFAPTSSALKNESLIAEIVLVEMNSTSISLPVTVNTPGVRTCPKPGQALHVITSSLDNESLVTFNVVGIIIFLFGISVPILFSRLSFGVTPIKVLGLTALIVFSPELTEKI